MNKIVEEVPYKKPDFYIRKTLYEILCLVMPVFLAFSSYLQDFKFKKKK